MCGREGEGERERILFHWGYFSARALSRISAPAQVWILHGILINEGQRCLPFFPADRHTQRHEQYHVWTHVETKEDFSVARKGKNNARCCARRCFDVCMRYFSLQSSSGPCTGIESKLKSINSLHMPAGSNSLRPPFTHTSKRNERGSRSYPVAASVPLTRSELISPKINSDWAELNPALGARACLCVW